MGHDITAIRDYNEYMEFWNNPNLNNIDSDSFREKNEIAYLRRSMGSETIELFYKALYCDNNYNGVSGDGSFIIVSLETLEEATEKISGNINLDGKDKFDYLKFINKCITWVTENKKREIIIHFG